MNRVRTAVLPVALAAAVLASLGVASPAQAATAYGCTVTADRPAFAGEFTVQGLPYVNYPLTVDCDFGLIAEVEQTRAEQDQLAVEGEVGDDITGVTIHTFDFTVNGAPQTIPVKRGLVLTGPATEGPAQEVYQSVRFRVRSGPVVSPWTMPVLTLPRTIYQ